MKTNSFYSTLGYDEFLKNNSEISGLYPDYKEIELLGADKVYFSGDSPAVLFVEVAVFNDVALRRIADIQHKAWNYRKILLLFALSDTEIRIYNCQAKPSYISENENINEKLNKIQIFDYNERSDKVALDVLSDIFSRIGVDCGLLWTTDYDVRKKVNIQRRLDKYLVQTLMNTASALENKGITERDIIHGLLMRSLFILFLEDKGAAQKAGLYKNIKKGANCYFDILEDIDATYQLFNEVQEHFNGNVFPVLPNERQMVKQEHLELIRKCFTDGDLSSDPKLFNDWKLFDFEIIQIELLSEIYENFLGEFKREKGQFYTPYSLVELILKEKLPTSTIEYNVKVLDPACGSGIFLVESYKRLIKRWKYANPKQIIGFEGLKRLLLDNIYGIEIDPTAIKVAAFSLYLALVDELDPKTLWIEKDYQLPNLIFDPDDLAIITQGNNLWRRDTIGEVNPEDFVKVDLVVGNPPFGTKKLMNSIKSYLDSNKFPQQMVLAFIYKAVDFAPKGQIALIFNTKSLTNTNKKFQNFRKWLLQKNHVEKVYNLSIFRNVRKDFGGQLFDEATVPISILYFQKEIPEIISETIEYCAPKTYIKSNLIEGIVFDSTDIKFLPRIECQKPDSKIWKIAMWGGIQDFQLITRVNKRFSSLKKYFTEQKGVWQSGTGYIADSQHLDIIPDKILRTQEICRYYTSSNAVFLNSRKFRKINKDLFTPPYIIIKEGQHKNEITASYIDYESSSLKSTYLINGKISSDFKKSIVAYINSTFASYYLFLSTSSWGIERERILFEELLDIPAIIKNISAEQLNEIVMLFDKIIKKTFIEDSSEIESKLDTIIYEVLNLSNKERILIEDCLKFQLDLFDNGVDSIGMHRTLEIENNAYAEILCNELNTFLSYSKIIVSASIYDVGLRDPLNLIVLHFGSTKKGIEKKQIEYLSENLKIIDRHLLQQKSDSIYVQKQVRYFDNDTVYLIKPNQKRFWTRSQAIDDATSLISEIINMESK